MIQITDHSKQQQNNKQIITNCDLEDAQETLCKSYLAWRQQPLPAWVEMKIKASQSLGSEAWRCDLCSFLHHRPEVRAQPEQCHEPRIKLREAMLLLQQPSDTALAAWKKEREEEAWNEMHEAPWPA
ncbi:unnamed protein product [Polarella glacialis]|uniref:Uncharacterized protein n=1 Tax=Polarella glacialis TaxID=89957 RepID=A0A813LB66_POLGL|nr:unnamed protein product [Polarella glacialis]